MDTSLSDYNRKSRYNKTKRSRHRKQHSPEFKTETLLLAKQIGIAKAAQQLRSHELQQSMSRKGDCWDNACVESFFHSLKVEAIQGEPIKNREQMRQAVFEYIEIDYNRQRRHSTLGYISPMDYESLTVA